MTTKAGMRAMPETGNRSVEGPRERQQDHRGPWPRVMIIALIVVALLIGGFWFLTQGPGARLVSPAGSTVAEFSGSGDEVTDSFQVREGWQIHWENSGDNFAFAITGDRDFGTVIEHEEPGSGVTSPVGKGTFQLEITADGPWAVEIIQGD